MNDDRFTVEESAALLHAVYPNYPDLRGMKLVPEVGAFLQGLRIRGSPHSGTSGVVGGARGTGRAGREERMTNLA